MSEQQQNEQSSTALELRNKAGELASYDYGEYAGVGTVYADKGNRIPYLSVLQPLSKACQEGHEKFVPGARPGMFLLGDELINGKEGCFFIGIEEQHVFVEKTSMDAQGEIVGEHAPDSDEVKRARAKFGQKKSQWRSSKGNLLIERFLMYGVVYRTLADIEAGKGVAAIIGFERTKLSAREHIMSPFNKLPAGKRPPLFAARVHLATAMAKGKKGDYYALVAKFAVDDDFVASLIKPNEPMWPDWAKQCVEVAKNVRAGKIKAVAEDGDEAEGGSGDGEDIPF